MLHRLCDYRSSRTLASGHNDTTLPTRSVQSSGLDLHVFLALLGLPESRRGADPEVGICHPSISEEEARPAKGDKASNGVRDGETSDDRT